MVNYTPPINADLYQSTNKNDVFNDNNDLHPNISSGLLKHANKNLKARDIYKLQKIKIKNTDVRFKLI